MTKVWFVRQYTLQLGLPKYTGLIGSGKRHFFASNRNKLIRAAKAPNIQGSLIPSIEVTKHGNTILLETLSANTNHRFLANNQEEIPKTTLY